eukprot:PhM_4_TR8092/c1_g1_i1/m.51747
MTAVPPSQSRPCYICGDIFADKLKLGMHIVRCYEAAVQSGRDVEPPDSIVEEGYTNVVMRDPKAVFGDMKAALKKGGATHDTTRQRVSAEMKAELEKIKQIRELEEQRVREREQLMEQRLRQLESGVGGGGYNPQKQALPSALRRPSTDGGPAADPRRVEVRSPITQQQHTHQHEHSRAPPVPVAPTAMPAAGGAGGAPVPPPGAKAGWTEFMVTYPRKVLAEEKPPSKQQREQHKDQRKEMRSMKDEEEEFRRMLATEAEGGGGVGAVPGRAPQPRPTSASRRPGSNPRPTRTPSSNSRPYAPPRHQVPQVAPAQRQPSPSRRPPSSGGGGGISMLFCNYCGRQFPSERLKLHSTICQKVAEKRAKSGGV